MQNTLKIRRPTQLLVPCPLCTFRWRPYQVKLMAPARLPTSNITGLFHLIQPRSGNLNFLAYVFSTPFSYLNNWDYLNYIHTTQPATLLP